MYDATCSAISDGVLLFNNDNGDNDKADPTAKIPVLHAIITDGKIVLVLRRTAISIRASN